jgi:putative restriction endonuclease
LAGKRIPLVGPQGIWKPAVCELPLSITTIVRGPYADAFDELTGTLSYAYRGTDPGHKDNVGLRTAHAERVPLIYFHSLEPGSYVAWYPVFVVRDDPSALRFSVLVDDISAAYASTTSQVADSGAEARREYVTRAVRQRLHQQLFPRAGPACVPGEMRTLQPASSGATRCSAHHARQPP